MVDASAFIGGRSERQRRQAANRHDKEAKRVIDEYYREKQTEAKKRAAERREKIIASCEYVLAQGTLKGQPLTSKQRREIEDILMDTRKRARHD